MPRSSDYHKGSTNFSRIEKIFSASPRQWPNAAEGSRSVVITCLIPINMDAPIALITRAVPRRQGAVGSS